MPNPELTILMPCLNEEETLADCILQARAFIKRSGVQAEILIADNGSTDRSTAIATEHGSRVIHVPTPGYGSALRAGITQAKGRYVIFADCDGSYDFLNLEKFLEELRQGADIVIGNRFRGGIAPGAMPIIHRYLGNPVLSFLGRLFYRTSVGDFHCGLRGVNVASIQKLHLRCPGMEFASEMIAKASLHDMKMVEIPTTLKPDKRSRQPHLNTWRDGWRHLRFLLLFAPAWLFLLPGLVFLSIGVVGTLLLFSGPFDLEGIVLHTATLFFSCLFILIGVQALLFHEVLRSIRQKMLPGVWHHQVTILQPGASGWAILIVLLCVSFGLGGFFYTLWLWSDSGFGTLDFHNLSRPLFLSATLFAVGIQMFLTDFLCAAMGFIAAEEPPPRRG